ncbi:MAG: hypothetical protein II081_05025, partial [Prevotella sp.]|nr:hypothetical protein [Prevotella sp.]
MKTICLYFEIHQIIHLKRYRFFDIGTDHYYYDDFENERSISDIAERSYMPALNVLQQMIQEHGKYFKVAFSLSGVGIEQLEMHAPQVLEKLQELNNTGCVEFLAEPYSHGLSALVNEECFAADVKKQMAKMQEYFGQTPTVIRNSSLIYSDEIGLQASQMGFKGMLTEGAKHVLGWKSPHYVYNCALAPNLKLLLRDVNLSDDISLRFNNSEWEGYPLFADNYIDKIASLPDEEQVINIFMELSALGIAQPLSSNILQFINALPACAKQKGITFATPTEICMKTKSVGALDVPDTLSWVDEDEMNDLAAQAPIGSDGVVIMPFGNGAERVLQNKELGCSFNGINFNKHSRAHLVRAAQEGIVFSFCYGMEIMQQMGMDIKKIHAGKANMFLSPLFRDTLAGVSGATIELYDTDGSVGAAKGAGIGAGIYSSPF